MKISLISGEYPPVSGGIGVLALCLTRGLALAGAKVTVITTSGATIGDTHSEPSEGIDVRRTCPTLNLRYVKLLPLWLGASRVHFRERPDYVLAMVWTHDGLVAYLLKKLFGLRYAIFAHGSEIIQTQGRLQRRLMTKVFRKADWVVANSNFTQRQVAALGIDTRKITVIHPPVERSSLLAASSIDHEFGLEGRRFLLTAARLVKRKGHSQVIRVLSQIRNHYPDLAYVITGNGSLRSTLELLAQEYGVQDRVRFAGYVSKDKLCQLYRRCTIYISPSEDDEGDVEGFGIALLEAGSYGKPVIAGRSGGVSDAVLDHQTGLLVDSRNLEEIRTALVTLLDKPALAEQLGERARERVEREFSLRGQGERLLRVLTTTEARSTSMP